MATLQCVVKLKGMRSARRSVRELGATARRATARILHASPVGGNADTEIGYLAGVLDAKAQLIRRAREPRSVCVRLADSREELLSLFEARFGGRISRNENNYTFSAAKAQFRWTLYGEAAEQMLAKLLPAMQSRASEVEAYLRERRFGQ